MSFEVNSLLADLQSQLSGLKTQLDQKGLGATFKSALLQNQVKLEAWYQTVLAQGGILSDEQKQALTNQLDSASKSALAASASRTKTTMTIVLVSVIVLTAGIIWYVKKHHK